MADQLTHKWYINRPLLVELFVLFNLAFLTLDVFIAHSVNAFHHWAEWIPVYFAAIATVILLAGFYYYRFSFHKGWAGRLGLIVGWLSILVGITGMILHLESQFFVKMTIRSLVYTAPFVAPLSFAGLGFLLLLNRKVNWESIGWGQWVIFFAWGGFIGNFILSLCDHAQNGFFNVNEWIPVMSSALAVGFLFTAMVMPANQSFLKLCFWIIGLQVLVGMVGFYFHLVVDLQGPASSLKDDFLYGAPIFAPLLLPNLAILATIGVWDMREKSRRMLNSSNQVSPVTA